MVRGLNTSQRAGCPKSIRALILWVGKRLPFQFWEIGSNCPALHSAGLWEASSDVYWASGRQSESSPITRLVLGSIGWGVPNKDGRNMLRRQW